MLFDVETAGSVFQGAEYPAGSFWLPVISCNNNIPKHNMQMQASGSL